MRIGLIGAGGFARAILLPGAALSPRVQVVAIHDVDGDAAAAAAQQFGIPHLCDSRAALLARDDIDLVSLSVPPGVMGELVSDIVAAGRHIQCAKPVGSGSAEVARLLTAAQDRGLLHSVDHQFRYAAIYRHMREQIRDNYIGAPRHVMLNVFVAYGVNPAWPTYYAGFPNLRAQSGGMLRQVGSHMLDLFLFLFGDVTMTGGYSATMVKQRPRPPAGGNSYAPPTQPIAAELAPVDADDQVVATGHLANGAPVSLSMGWSGHHGSGVRWEIYGSEGTLVYQSDGNLWGGTLRGGRHDEPALMPIALPSEFCPQFPPGDQPDYMAGMVAAELDDLARTIAGEPADRLFATFADELVTWRNTEAVPWPAT